jgi:branched-chain amino acid transport system substrate-binding protein
LSDDPGFVSVQAYDAANVVLDALEARRDGESLKETILRVGTFQGIQGPIQLDAHGDAIRRSLISTVFEGRFRVLE